MNIFFCQYSQHVKWKMLCIFRGKKTSSPRKRKPCIIKWTIPKDDINYFSQWYQSWLQHWWRKEYFLHIEYIFSRVSKYSTRDKKNVFREKHHQIREQVIHISYCTIPRIKQNIWHSQNSRSIERIFFAFLFMTTFWQYPTLIAIFSITILVMLALDLGVFHKKNHTPSNKEALIWSLVWISLAMLFSGLIYYFIDLQAGTTESFARFQAAYWIEKALSVDNLFVFILVFGFFKIPPDLQHKILFWGILWALLFRAIFIFAGVEVIAHTSFAFDFLWIHADGTPREINIVLAIFGVFLLYAGWKSLFAGGEEESLHIEKSRILTAIKRVFPIDSDISKGKFFLIKDGIKYATPLFLALVMIEMTDLVFALDSIPAIFAIAPDDAFILYTSNIFAILGLRSLYFLLANSMHMFSKLHYGLALVLGFIGAKMILAPWVHISSLLSLGIIAIVLLVSIVWSVASYEKAEKVQK